MKPLAGTLLLLAFALSACAGSHRTQTGEQATLVATQTISSSRLILGGRVRCIASVATPVEAGQETGVTFSLHNVSGSAVRAPQDSTWLVVRAPDGTTYNTQQAQFAEGSLGGPYRAPVPIPAGATRSMGSPDVAVRWKGPLRITPVCERTPLPPLHLSVAAPGPPPDNQSAISSVQAATGHLLDHCLPQTSGVAVDGQIDSPSRSGPSMDAKCSVRLQSAGRFLVAQVIVSIPRDLRNVHVRQPYETLSFAKHRRPYEAIAWELVVTKDGATTVAGSMHDTTRAGKGMATGWTWSHSAWNGPDTGRCGFEGLSGGPAIDLIYDCPH